MSSKADKDDQGLLTEDSPVESMDWSPFDMRRGHLIFDDDGPLFWVTVAQRPYVVLCGESIH
jgi:hypothetical protein